MTREEKLWAMTGTTLLGVAEKLGIKTTKSTLKQGKETLIAKILEVEHMIEETNKACEEENQEKKDLEAAEKEAKDLWEKKANEEKAARDQKQTENDKVAENEINKPKTETKSARRGTLIEYDGRSQNICAWAKELGISANTLYGRIYKLGWPVEKAFTTPSSRQAKQADKPRA